MEFSSWFSDSVFLRSVTFLWLLMPIMLWQGGDGVCLHRGHPPGEVLMVIDLNVLSILKKLKVPSVEAYNI